nr:putative reverse transcriptase domain-containing protein [Tanacetum cinerariifolium]
MLPRRSAGEELKYPFFEDELEMRDDAFMLIGKEVAPNSKIAEAMPHYRLCLGEHEELRRQVEEFVSKGHIRKIMSTCAQPHGPLDLMSLHVFGFVPKKVHDFIEGLPYHGDSSDDDLVGNLRTDFFYPWGNDEGPSIQEITLLFLEAQDCVKKKA